MQKQSILDTLFWSYSAFYVLVNDIFYKIIIQLFSWSSIEYLICMRYIAAFGMCMKFFGTIKFTQNTRVARHYESYKCCARAYLISAASEMWQLPPQGHPRRRAEKT